MNTKLFVLLAAGVLALSACNKEATDSAAQAAKPAKAEKGEKEDK